MRFVALPSKRFPAGAIESSPSKALDVRHELRHVRRVERAAEDGVTVSLEIGLRIGVHAFELSGAHGAQLQT